MEGPNPLAAGLSMLRARRVGRPRSSGTVRAPGSGELGSILESVRLQGVAALPDLLDDLDQYTLEQSRIDPDELTHDDALAYWLNLYNAGALVLAGEAFATATGSVLRLPGAFTSPFVTVAGESLSLDAVEHGKIRRFGDPRIHSALVCGSASCPTLRFEPYEGARLDEQLDDQTRSFLEGGGAVIDEDTLRLSRVFLWYGADFVRPRRMPTFMPAGKRQVAEALTPWLPDRHTRWLRSGRRSIAFQSYDWSLACSVRKPV